MEQPCTCQEEHTELLQRYQPREQWRWKMATIQGGQVDEYKESLEDFESYLEILELWMFANDIKDDKNVRVFPSVIGAETYGLLKSYHT